MRCAAKGFICHYDRTGDELFHDETASIQAKVKKAKARSIAARNLQGAPETALVSTMVQGPPVGHYIAPHLVDQGINFFMSYHALGLDQPLITSEAYHQHLATDGFHPVVATTMAALGIAGVANLHLDPSLKRVATNWYLKAIKMVNAAISSPEEVRNDSTLVAVNLLSMFEALTNDSSLAGWSSHVEGAAAIVKVRGIKQFSTPAGRRMYLHTTGLLTMNQMGKGQPMPDYLRELNDEIMGYLDMTDPRNAFFFLHMKTNDLRAHIIGQRIPDLRDIIDRAIELDTIALSIFQKAGAEWQYETVPYSGEIPAVFGDEYHVYPTHATAQTWSWVRYNRIYYHDIIRNTILAGMAASPPVLKGLRYTELLRTSTGTLAQLQSDILASMPQFLHDTPMTAPDISTHRGYLSSSQPVHARTALGATSPRPDAPASEASMLSPTQSDASSSSNFTGAGRKQFFENFNPDTMSPNNLYAANDSIPERLPIVRISGGYSTLWALYVAGSMPTASFESQVFVLYCFGRIEREFGINQAKVLAKALRIKQQMVNGGETAFSLCPWYLPPDPGPDVPWQEPDKVCSLFTGSISLCCALRRVSR
jgi:hypothetical protein